MVRFKFDNAAAQTDPFASRHDAAAQTDPVVEFAATSHRHPSRAILYPASRGLRRIACLIDSDVYHSTELLCSSFPSPGPSGLRRIACLPYPAK
jgi:hypothetical protein